jgi:hypothetical protein
VKSFNIVETFSSNEPASYKSYFVMGQGYNRLVFSTKQPFVLAMDQFGGGSTKIHVLFWINESYSFFIAKCQLADLPPESAVLTKVSLVFCVMKA